jgi:hypothetical protein
MPVSAFIRSLSQRFTRARNRQPHQQQSEEKTSAASGATTFDGGPRVKSRSPIPHNKVNGGGGVEQMTGSVTTRQFIYTCIIIYVFYSFFFKAFLPTLLLVW